MASLGFAFVYKAYHGLACPSPASMVIAKACSAALVVLVFIMILGAFGNVNGLLSFTDRRFSLALAGGIAPSSVQYWEAMTVIESLLWTVNLAWLAYVAGRLWAPGLFPPLEDTSAPAASSSAKAGAGGGTAVADAVSTPTPRGSGLSLRGLFGGM